MRSIHQVKGPRFATVFHRLAEDTDIFVHSPEPINRSFSACDRTPPLAYSTLTRKVGASLSLVERYVRDVEVVSSNLTAPTIFRSPPDESGCVPVRLSETRAVVSKKASRHRPRQHKTPRDPKRPRHVTACVTTSRLSIRAYSPFTVGHSFPTLRTSI